MSFKLRILPNLLWKGKTYQVFTTNSSKTTALMKSITSDYQGLWGLIGPEQAPPYLQKRLASAFYSEEAPVKVLLDVKYYGKDYRLVALPSCLFEAPDGWIGWRAHKDYKQLKKKIEPFLQKNKDYKYYLVPKEDCLQAPDKDLVKNNSEREILDMEKEQKKYVGSVIKSTDAIFGWAEGKTIKAVLRNKENDKLFALIEDEDAVEDHYSKDNYPEDEWEFFPKRLKLNNLLEIPVEQIEELEEKKRNKIMDVDTTKIKESGKKMAGSFQHGIKVGAATEGAEFVYKQICAVLQNQFGVSQQTLENKLNKELIMLAGVAMLHAGSTIFDETIPGMEHVQQGCELVLEGKGKDNAQAVLQIFAPLLMQAAERMDPEKAMQRFTTDVAAAAQAPKVRAPQETVKAPEAEAEAEEEALVEAAGSSTAVAQVG